MNKFLTRLLLFVVAVPLLILMVFLDWGSHFFINFFVIICSILGSIEMGNLLTHNNFPINKRLTPFLGASIPLLAYFEVLGFITQEWMVFLLILFVAGIFTRQIFKSTPQDFTNILHKVSGNLLVFIYPGLFFYFITKISELPLASEAYLVFLFMTFGNDTFAYIFGKLLGKYSSKPFVASPNKSVIGFIGGFSFTLATAFIAQWLFPELLGPHPLQALLLGSAIGLTTILGDLFESALKRSADSKDSGNLIPGRGGILDSVDSLLFSAPVFYFFIQLI